MSLRDPQGRVIDSHHDQIQLTEAQRCGRVERERGVATLMVAEMDAIQPYVCQVIDCAEFQRQRQAGPAGGNLEAAAVPSTELGRIGRQVEGTRDGDLLPAGIIESGALAPFGCRGDLLHRLFPVGQREIGVETRALDAPLPAEVDTLPWLEVEGRHRDAILHGNLAPVHGFHLQRWRQAARPHRGRACDEVQHSQHRHQAGRDLTVWRSAARRVFAHCPETTAYSGPWTST